MEKTKVYKKLGRNIAKLRNKKGLSQDDIAAEKDISRATVFRIEMGLTNARVGTLIEIADALDVPLQKLFEFE